jgi:hypothetical protein
MKADGEGEIDWLCNKVVQDLKISGDWNGLFVCLFVV